MNTNTIDYVDVDMRQVLETEYEVATDVDMSDPTSKAQAWERLDRVADAVLSGKYYMISGAIKHSNMLANNHVCALGALMAEHPGFIFGYESSDSYSVDGTKLSSEENDISGYYGINSDFRFSLDDLSDSTRIKLSHLNGYYSDLVSINDACATAWERADILASIIRDRPDSLINSDLTD